MIKGATIKGSGKMSLEKQTAKEVHMGTECKGSPSMKMSSRTMHAGGFHCGYGKTAVKGQHK